jgi:hypothetical protein
VWGGGVELKPDETTAENSLGLFNAIPTTVKIIHFCEESKVYHVL